MHQKYILVGGKIKRLGCRRLNNGADAETGQMGAENEVLDLHKEKRYESKGNLQQAVCLEKNAKKLEIYNGYLPVV